MCKKILKSIDLYIDGEIPEKQRKYIEKHIEKCERCRIVYQNKLNRRNLLKKNFEDGHHTFFNEIERQIDKNIGKEISYRKKIRTLKKQTYAVAAIAAIFILVVLFSVGPYQKRNADLNLADDTEDEVLSKYDNIEKNLHHIKNYSMVNIIGTHITYNQNIIYIPDNDFEEYDKDTKSGGRYPIMISPKNVVVSL